VIALCVAHAAAAQTAPSVPQPSPWSLEIISQRAPVTNYGIHDTWATDGIQATWVRPEKAGWFVVVQRQRRYGLVDSTALTQGYYRTRNWTVLGAVGGTPDAHFLYRFTAGGEISRRVAGTSVGSFGYHYFRFPGGDVQQLQPGFTWYHASGEIQAVGFITRKSMFDQTTGAAMVRASHQLTKRLRLAGGVAYGDRIFDIASLSAPTAHSRLAFGDIRIGFTAHDFMLAGVSVAHEEPAFTYRSFSIGYRRGF